MQPHAAGVASTGGMKQAGNSLSKTRKKRVMTDIQISEKTGLPVLPEGEVWRVKFEPEAFSSDPSGWVLQIETIPPEPRWSDWVSEQTMFIDQHVFNIEYREVVESTSLFGKKQTRKEQRCLTAPAAAVLAARSIGTRDNPPTAKDVQEAATQMVEARDRREDSMKLAGTYPPNKLEVPSDDWP